MKRKETNIFRFHTHSRFLLHEPFNLNTKPLPELYFFLRFFILFYIEYISYHAKFHEQMPNKRLYINSVKEREKEREREKAMQPIKIFTQSSILFY